MTWLDERPRQSHARLIELLHDHLPADADEVAELAWITYRWYAGYDVGWDVHRRMRILERRWYDALAETGEPDYTVYDDPRYVAECWACWILYARRYIRAIVDPKSGIGAALGSVASVVDLGCGIGFSTAALAEIFPAAEVAATNVPDAAQTVIARAVGAEAGFVVVEHPPPAELVFASEYLEHFEAPVAHLQEIVETCEPRALLLASTFGPDSIGHFDRYVVGDHWADARATSRAVSAALGGLGFVKVPVKCWNGRPTLWIRPFDAERRRGPSGERSPASDPTFHVGR